MFVFSVDREFASLSARFDPDGRWASSLKKITEDQWEIVEELVSVPVGPVEEEEVDEDY